MENTATILRHQNLKYSMTSVKHGQEVGIDRIDQTIAVINAAGARA